METFLSYFLIAAGSLLNRLSRILEQSKLMAVPGAGLTLNPSRKCNMRPASPSTHFPFVA
jgi:hypothetical protein